ncbi:hypothetical protein FEM48_Zijuj12G0113400 [Ziziphus jujuba var. spinosa]|uniref:Apple domain-containing protein n=1 Tax=Ziziphus jujuba var. spinosa TaxID=714518 RepID=A0A978UD07_ZIZJJ|nr:hypothetical protein FEM48_Zijuj12G0113400 [Ziziphus jujuba var. spinosa]
MVTSSISSNFLFHCFLLLSFFFVAITQAEVPSEQTFNFINHGEFGKPKAEYNANYRVIQTKNHNFFTYPFQLCFYSTIPGSCPKEGPLAVFIQEPLLASGHLNKPRWSHHGVGPHLVENRVVLLEQPPAIKRLWTPNKKVNYFNVTGAQHFTSNEAVGGEGMSFEECKSKCDTDCKCLGFVMFEDFRCIIATVLGTLSKTQKNYTAYIKY